MDGTSDPLRQAGHAPESHAATSRGVRTFACDFLGPGTELAVQEEEIGRSAPCERAEGSCETARQQRSEIIRHAIAGRKLQRPENAARCNGLEWLGAENAVERHTR